MRSAWQDLTLPWVQASDIITWGGTVDGSIYVLGRPDLSADGVAMTATLRSGRTAHGDPSQIKMVRQVYVQVSNLDSTTPLYLSIGMSNTPEGAQTWTAPVAITATGWVDIEAVGRYLDYKFTKTGGTFSLEAYAPDLVRMGEN
jgi:hypothetical protein